MRCATTLLFALLLAGIAATPGFSSLDADGMGEDVSVPGLAGRLFVPAPERWAGVKRPLVVALHGGGGGGTDNVSNLRDMGQLIVSAPERGLFLYVPQAPMSWSVGDLQRRIVERIDGLIAEHAIDPDRVYLTGFSLGGGGTWNLLHAYPERFAAAVPICAEAPSASFTAQGVAGVPIWAFHARDDGSMPVDGTRTVVNRLLEEAGSPAMDFRYLSSDDFELVEDAIGLRYTEWASGNHGIWHRVYREDAMFEWLLTQSRGNSLLQTEGPRLLRHPQSQTVPPGATVRLSVEALARAGELHVSWWKDGAEIAGAGGADLELTAVAGGDAGTYRARLQDDTGVRWSRPALLWVGVGEAGPLLNLSVRARLDDGGADALTAGFVVGGSSPGRFLLRAVGPGLIEHGVSAALEDPVLLLHWHRDGRSEIFATGDDWSGDELLAAARREAAVQAGAFPLVAGSRDAAIVVDLPAGVFTVEARSRDGGGGMVLVEVYELR